MLSKAVRWAGAERRVRRLGAMRQVAGQRAGTAAMRGGDQRAFAQRDLLAVQAADGQAHRIPWCRLGPGWSPAAPGRPTSPPPARRGWRGSSPRRSRHGAGRFPTRRPRRPSSDVAQRDGQELVPPERAGGRVAQVVAVVDVLGALRSASAMRWRNRALVWPSQGRRFGVCSVPGAIGRAMTGVGARTGPRAMAGCGVGRATGVGVAGGVARASSGLKSRALARARGRPRARRAWPGAAGRGAVGLVMPAHPAGEASRRGEADRILIHA